MADFALDENGDLKIEGADVPIVYDDEAQGQKIRIALKHVQGEWFRDQNAGTDWLGSILGKVSALTQRAEFRRRILGVPGIREVAGMSLTVDSTRHLTGSIEVLRDDGLPLEVRFQEA
jgi:hypothetical protein